MTSMLITTKLYAPPPRPDWVARPRLMARLDESQGLPLTLVSAPPGFGKTALVCDWLARRAPAAAWLSLEAADDDPRRFWRYVLAALQTARPALGQAVLTMLAAPEAAPLEAVAAALVNDLAADPQPLTLVLDDYHQITAEPLHASLNFVLDHAPGSLHLILITREDPPLALARRRARRQIVEIRAADLRFTDDEVTAFLNTARGLGLDPADVAVLAARTEGWIVGLQLAALLLEGQTDRHRLVASFAGNDRYIADYLVEEVLQRQPPAIQAFLLKTSVLARLCGPLCDAVLDEGPLPADAETAPAPGRPSSSIRRPSSLVLEELDRANLFLIPLDNRREWYRYHHLFADLLQSRLEQALGPEAVAGLHRRAGAWFRERGLVMEAVQHWQRSGDHALAARLLQDQSVVFFQRSELSTLVALVAALPHAVLADHPGLCLAYAWAAHATGRLEDSRAALRLVEQALGVTVEDLEANLPVQIRNALAEVAVIHAQHAISRADMPTAIAIGERVQPILEGPEALRPGLFNPPANLRPVVAYNLAFAREMQGQTAVARRTYTEAAAIAQAHDNIHIVALCAGRLGQLQIISGQLSAAEQTLRQALQHLADRGQALSPLAGMALAGLGDILYERNDLEAARRHLEQGYALARPWRNAEGLGTGALGLARLRLALGDPTGAESILEEAAALCGHAPPVPPLLEAWRAVVWARQGRLDAAEDWARGSGLDLAASLAFPDEERAFCLARVRAAQGRWGEAIQWLERLAASAEAGGRHGRLIQVSVLRAVALAAQGRRAEAAAALERALALGEPESYARAFVDEDESVQALLNAVSGPTAAYARRLADLFPGRASPLPPRPAPASPLAEPLTPRELEVLRLMAEGLSNQEIADRLVISLGTVKTHTANIHGKLGVNSRMQAVIQARALGLLP